MTFKKLLVALGLLAAGSSQASDIIHYGKIASYYSDEHSVLETRFILDKASPMCGVNTPIWAFVDKDNTLTGKFYPLLSAAFQAQLNVVVTVKPVTVSRADPNLYCEITSVRLNGE